MPLRDLFGFAVWLAGLFGHKRPVAGFGSCACIRTAGIDAKNSNRSQFITIDPSTPAVSLQIPGGYLDSFTLWPARMWQGHAVCLLAERFTYRPFPLAKCSSRAPGCNGAGKRAFHHGAGRPGGDDIVNAMVAAAFQSRIAPADSCLDGYPAPCSRPVEFSALRSNEACPNPIVDSLDVPTTCWWRGLTARRQCPPVQAHFTPCLSQRPRWPDSAMTTAPS